MFILLRARTHFIIWLVLISRHLRHPPTQPLVWGSRPAWLRALKAVLRNSHILKRTLVRQIIPRSGTEVKGKAVRPLLVDVEDSTKDYVTRAFVAGSDTTRAFSILSDAGCHRAGQSPNHSAITCTDMRRQELHWSPTALDRKPRTRQSEGKQRAGVTRVQLASKDKRSIPRMTVG